MTDPLHEDDIRQEAPCDVGGDKRLTAEALERLFCRHIDALEQKLRDAKEQSRHDAITKADDAAEIARLEAENAELRNTVHRKNMKVACMADVCARARAENAELRKANQTLFDAPKKLHDRITWLEEKLLACTCGAFDKQDSERTDDDIAERVAEIRKRRERWLRPNDVQDRDNVEEELALEDIPWLCDTVERLLDRWERVRQVDQMQIVQDIERERTNDGH